LVVVVMVYCSSCRIGGGGGGGGGGGAGCHKLINRKGTDYKTNNVPKTSINKVLKNVNFYMK
jgi:hypothetical protein